MKKLSVAMMVVGLVQIILGISYLLVPQGMLAWMGHSVIAPDWPATIKVTG